MADRIKCAHPVCQCLVTKDSAYGKYCSEHCKEAAGEIRRRCECQHATCKKAAKPRRSALDAEALLRKRLADTLA